ncbi:MAG: hypothetical protein IJ906_03005, partial [Oscillospiraceae bacterium]|nr:hypothetical protein [Oscillospiraceae bacterium]
MMKKIGSFFAAFSVAAFAIVPAVQEIPVNATGYLRPTIEISVPTTGDSVTGPQSIEQAAVL